jgi:hypothetical protein
VGVPKVGIFFVVDDQLLLDAVPVEQGDPYGDTIGYGPAGASVQKPTV